MSERIRWTDEEQNKVAVAIGQHLLNNPGTSLPNAYKAVENLLPKNRRRSMAAVVQFDKMLPTILDTMNPPKCVEKPEPEVRVVEKTLHITQKLSDISTDDLQAELNRRLMEPMLKEIANRVSQQVIQSIKNPAPVIDEPSSKKKKLPKRLIVGLIAEQKHSIKSEFKDVYDLRFHNASDDSTQVLQERCANVDEVILMTKFINHKHQDLVKKSGAPFSFCNGGVSELQKMLEAEFLQK